MERNLILVSSAKTTVRSLEDKDAPFFFSCCENIYTEKEVAKLIKENKNKSFLSKGLSFFAIEDKQQQFIGGIKLEIKFLEINFDFLFNKDLGNQFLFADMIVNVIRYLHKLYPYKKIVSYVDKSNYLKRGVLETLAFKRIDLNKETNIYTYQIYLANEKKDKE